MPKINASTLRVTLTLCFSWIDGKNKCFSVTQSSRGGTHTSFASVPFSPLFLTSTKVAPFVFDRENIGKLVLTPPPRLQEVVSDVVQGVDGGGEQRVEVINYENGSENHPHFGEVARKEWKYWRNLWCGGGKALGPLIFGVYDTIPFAFLSYLSAGCEIK